MVGKFRILELPPVELHKSQGFHQNSGLAHENNTPFIQTDRVYTSIMRSDLTRFAIPTGRMDKTRLTARDNGTS